METRKWEGEEGEYDPDLGERGGETKKKGGGEGGSNCGRWMMMMQL